MSDLTTAREFGRAGKTPLFWMANEPFASEYRRGEAEMFADAKWVGPDTATCKQSLPVQNETREWVGPDNTPCTSHAVPSLSGEFPGLGKWELCIHHTGNMNFAVDKRVLIVANSTLDIYSFATNCAFNMLWHTLLSALPPREVTGDYVVGPHRVKFQVERITFGDETNKVDCLNIKADGHRLIVIDAKQIWIYRGGPLYDESKSIDKQSWPLRGEA